MADESSALPETVPTGARKPLTPAARRALAEARPAAPPANRYVCEPERGSGPKGPEPTRFGDWERNGIASDF